MSLTQEYFLCGIFFVLIFLWQQAKNISIFFWKTLILCTKFRQLVFCETDGRRKGVYWRSGRASSLSGLKKIFLHSGKIGGFGVAFGAVSHHGKSFARGKEEELCCLNFFTFTCFFMKNEILHFLKSDAQELILQYSENRESASSYWHKVLSYSYFTILKNFLILQISKNMPSGKVKNFFLKMTGMYIGKNVFIGAGCVFDKQFPQLIHIEDNVIIGMDTHILAHEVTHTHVKLARTRIKKNALIGAMSIIRGGMYWGELCCWDGSFNF